MSEAAIQWCIETQAWAQFENAQVDAIADREGWTPELRERVRRVTILGMSDALGEEVYLRLESK